MSRRTRSMTRPGCRPGARGAPVLGEIILWDTLAPDARDIGEAHERVEVDVSSLLVSFDAETVHAVMCFPWHLSTPGHPRAARWLGDAVDPGTSPLVERERTALAAALASSTSADGTKPAAAVVAFSGPAESWLVNERYAAAVTRSLERTMSRGGEEPVSASVPPRSFPWWSQGRKWRRAWMQVCIDANGISETWRAAGRPGGKAGLRLMCHLAFGDVGRRGPAWSVGVEARRAVTYARAGLGLAEAREVEACIVRECDEDKIAALEALGALVLA